MKNKLTISDIKFRCLEIEDTERLYSIHNNKLIKDSYTGHPFPVSLESTQKWIKNVSEPNNNLSLFGIEVEQDFVGICGLKGINNINRTAELFIYLDSNQQGKGIASLSVVKLLDFGFCSLNLNRIFLQVQEDNTKAINLYTKNKFVVEGELRKAVFKNNKYINVIVMGILKEDF